jgi:hypothetical protein
MQKVVGSSPIIRFFIIKRSPVMRGFLLPPLSQPATHRRPAARYWPVVPNQPPARQQD